MRPFLLGQKMRTTSVFRVAVTGANITTSAVSASTTIPDNSAGTKRFIRVSTTANAHIRVGTGAQTAVTTDMLIITGETVCLDVTNCDTIAAIQNAAAGTVNITPVEM